MLYYYLAESLSELDMLTDLTKQLEISNAPLTELMNEQFLKEEIRRIKARASMDILIFGSHAGIYFSKNMTEINRLILRIFELLNDLPDHCLMNEKERYRYRYGMVLKEELSDLSVFFYELRKTHEDPEAEH
jgi:hypothetical protein